MKNFNDLSEVIPDEDMPPLFRENLPERYYNENGSLNLTQDQADWRNDGLIIKRNFVPREIIDAYCARFEKDRGSAPSPRVGGVWRDNVPYMHVKEIRNICLFQELSNLLESLIGSPMGLHLNLVEWTSTERQWHQDDYLNPEFLNNHYVAVWFALDDIHPDSGPFEFIRGSHKWPLMRRGKVWDAAPQEMKSQPNWSVHWPSLTQDFVSNAIQEKITVENHTIETFIPANKGDILVWSGALVHRGSSPNVRGMERKALISHYSAIDHRLDMPVHETIPQKGSYFVL